MFFPVSDDRYNRLHVYPYVTKSVIVLCVVMYAVMWAAWIYSPRMLELLVDSLSLTPSTLGDGGVAGYCVLLAYSLMHANIFHLVGNLWFFSIFADNVEEVCGSLLFGVLLLAASAASGMTHVFATQGTLSAARHTVGLSGTVNAVMGMYMIFFPRVQVKAYFCPVWFFIRRVYVPAWIIVALSFLFDVLCLRHGGSVTGGVEVARMVHVGGFVFGVCAAGLLKTMFGLGEVEHETVLPGGVEIEEKDGSQRSQADG